jgi:hypothetical protein
VRAEAPKGAIFVAAKTQGDSNKNVTSGNRVVRETLEELGIEYVVLEKNKAWRNTQTRDVWLAGEMIDGCTVTVVFHDGGSGLTNVGPHRARRDDVKIVTREVKRKSEQRKRVARPRGAYDRG